MAESLPEPIPESLFVYGSLRRHGSHPNAARLAAEARWLGNARLRGHLHDAGGYPGLIVDARGELIEGDLYALHDPPRTLAWLDHYEECSPAFPAPREYQRVNQTVLVEPDRRPIQAWVYVYRWPSATLPPWHGPDATAQ